MNAQMVSNVLNVEVDNSIKIPVEHLDYDYIEKCTDLRYLEKILNVLRWVRNNIGYYLWKARFLGVAAILQKDYDTMTIFQG